MNIGFMQGRLSPIVDGMIQAFPWESWKNEFEIAAENNYKAIEWTLDYKDMHENPFLTEIGQKDIIFLKGKFNILIPSLTGDFFMHRPFFKYEGEEKSQLLDDLNKVIESCNIIGTKYLVIPLVDNGSLSTRADEDILVESLLKIVEFLKEKSVTIIFESDYTPMKLAEFINRLPPECFGINYDSGNSAALNYDINEEFSAYQQRILNIHIKDRMKAGTTVPLGTGNTNFKLLFKKIQNIKYQGNLILQTARAEDSNHIGILNIYREFVIKHLEIQ